MKKRNVKYTDEPVGKIKMVDDFLPKPKDLVLKEQRKKTAKQPVKDDFNEKILAAHKRSFQRAFETAVRTGTALVFTRNGKVVEIKPPYRYELVPIKPTARKKKRSKRLKKS